MSPVDGVYKFSNVTLYEGTLVNFKYTVDSTDVDQRFVIPNSTNTIYFKSNCTNFY